MRVLSLYFYLLIFVVAVEGYMYFPACTTLYIKIQTLYYFKISYDQYLIQILFSLYEDARVWVF